MRAVTISYYIISESSIVAIFHERIISRSVPYIRRYHVRYVLAVATDISCGARAYNNPHPFRSTIGNYPLKAQRYNDGKKRTVAFWDQSYGTLAKTAGMGCKSLKSVACRVGASPIVFTDVMPTPAVYSPGSNVPREAREDTDEQSILMHHEAIFSMREVMDRVTVVILAGHRHGKFRKRERTMLEHATISFAELCSQRAPPIETVQTKSMFGNNQAWNIDAVKANDQATRLIENVINRLLELDGNNSAKTK